MTATFLLKGLDCPNCAAKIEDEVKALPGVASAICSAATSRLSIEAEGAPADYLAAVKRIVKSHEPDVEVVPGSQAGKNQKEDEKDEIDEKDEKKDGESAKARNQIIQFAAGAAILLAAVTAGDVPARPFIYLAAYAALGWKVVFRAITGVFRGRLFSEHFLMSVATAGAFALGEYTEAVAVMLFYLIGEFLQDLAVRKSRRSISDLMDIRPDYAWLAENGTTRRVAPGEVKIGDTVIVKPGERIPLDGTVTSGESMLDTKALTGEPVPKRAAASDGVYSGCINLNGALTVKVTKNYSDSTASKILDLIENAIEKKAPSENFITKFSKYYTPAVVGLAILLALIPPPLFGMDPAESARRALIFLVVSCPCALVISVPLGFFGGIGRASKHGVLVKGGNYLEALADLETAVFDKTGTLTEGVFEVTQIVPAAGLTEDALLGLAARAEALSNHPIALSVLKAYGKDVDKGELAEFSETAGYGVGVKAGGARLLAGNGRLMAKENIAYEEAPESGSAVYVAADGVYAGHLIISDKIKPDARSAIAELKKLGVKKTVMLTGDGEQAAKAVSDALGVDEFYARLLPVQKVGLIESFLTQKRGRGKTAFVGDGINDAPALARADVGIAMGGMGSDAAIEAADIALMTDEPSKIADAVKIAKATKRIVTQNIIFALGVKAVFLALGASGISGMWEAVFADMGVALLAVFNAMRILGFRPRPRSTDSM